MNDDDTDSDGIPDYADGFNYDGEADTDDDTTTDEKFIPLRLAIAAGAWGKGKAGGLKPERAGWGNRSAPLGQGLADALLLSGGGVRQGARRAPDGATCPGHSSRGGLRPVRARSGTNPSIESPRDTSRAGQGR